MWGEGRVGSVQRGYKKHDSVRVQQGRQSTSMSVSLNSHKTGVAAGTRGMQGEAAIIAPPRLRSCSWHGGSAIAGGPQARLAPHRSRPPLLLCQLTVFFPPA